MTRFRVLIHLIVTIVFMACTFSTFAFDFYQDGVYYTINGNGVSVTYDVEYMFDSYSGDVVIPSSVTYFGKTYSVTAIGDYAFSKCVGLKSITLPNTITAIGYCAFEGCSWLTSVTIPSSVTSIDVKAFSNCLNLSNITVASGNNTYDSRNNCNAIIETASNWLIVGCLGTAIPNGVEMICDYAFEGCVKLKNIYIPNSVTIIGHDAFLDCLSLEQVHMGNSLQIIDYNAFRNCHKLQSISLPNSVTTIGNAAFYNCCELASVDLGNSVETIDAAAFYGCSKLSKVVIPASTLNIGLNAYSSCPNIVSIRVTEGNRSYDSRNNCNAIIEKSSNQLIAGCQNTVIPNTVTSIGYGAFEGCEKLKTVSLSGSINHIESNAFNGCIGMTDIYSWITKFSEFYYGDNIFSNIPTTSCKLHVVEGSKRVYQSLDQWREFEIVEESHPSDSNGDGEINISDVNYIISLILSGGYDVSADANHDGEVTIADVNTVIGHILRGNDDYNLEYCNYVLNHIYRSMHQAGWSTTGNTHQCFGISAYNLMAEVMGDDFIMGAQGSGWFWFDAAYNVKSRYTSGAWRSYDLWNAYYTWIANANELLSFKDELKTDEANYVIGQAYAIRAYSYFMLAQSFARTYAGHQNDPCVPIYNGTAFSAVESTGQPRSTVSQVYAQIDDDLNKAISLLVGTTQKQPAHMGLAVALGLQARVALVKEDWNMALNAAEGAISASRRTILDVPSFIGLNDADAQNVIWGVNIPPEEVGMYASLFSHMGTDIAYGQRAPKQISPWLYAKMNATDARRAWWDPNDYNYSTGGYIQRKFYFSNLSTWEGDYIWMRLEEMYLTAAEAACRLGIEATAKRYLMDLMSKRDPNYSCNKTGNALGTLTTDETGSLLEEILLQRRIELWGEDGRIYTIRRLRQGFERTYDRGWPSGLLIPSHAAAAKDPESYLWVLTIPQVEFDGNENMDFDRDQNPIGDYPW